MPTLVRPSYGRTKPPAGSQVDWNHPLTRGLSLYVPFNEGSGTTVVAAHPQGMLPVTAPGANQGWAPPTTTATGVQIGMGYRFTSTDGNIRFPTSVIPTQGMTIVIGYRKTDTTPRDSVAFAKDGDNNNRCQIHLPYVDGTVYFDFGGFSEGSTRVSVGGLTFGGADTWGFTTGARGMEIWQNGILRASNSADPVLTMDGTVFALGCSPVSSGSDLAEYAFFAMWKRQLGRAELVQMYEAPFAMLRGPDRWRGYDASVLAAGAAGGPHQLINAGLINRGLIDGGLIN